MRSVPRSIRSAALVAAATTVAALLGAPSVAPTASAAAPGAGQADRAPVQLTQGQLDRRGAKFLPRTDGTPGLVADASGADDAATQQGAAPKAAAPRSDADSGTSTGGLVGTGGWETPRGAVSTLSLGGSQDWVGIYSGGTVGRYDVDGDPIWQRSTGSLYDDYQVSPQLAFQDEPFSPVLFQGYNPYQPSTVGRHPFAQTDVNHDGVDDIAVAYDVGDNPPRPFTVDGSDLSSGTFVTVFDGATGRTLWHRLLPGYVGSMHAEDGVLVVADTTGPAWYSNPVATQGDSRSSLVAYSFRSGSHGAVTAKESWRYSTKAPWANFSDVESAGAHRVVVGWTDTPMGLGDPRPPAGHVVVLDLPDGYVESDVKTPGYPRMVQDDPTSDGVLVVEQNDPLDAVRWSLTSIDPRTDKRTELATRENTIPLAFDVNAGAHGKQPAYAVAELGINPDLSDGASSVSAWDASGRTLWTHETATTIGAAETPVLDVAVDDGGRGTVLATVADPVASTSAHPEGPEHSQLLAFDARSGSSTWSREGEVSGNQITLYQGDALTVGYNLTASTTDLRSGRASVMPLLGDAYGAAAVDVNSDHVEDLVVGGQSQGVFALDGRTLEQPTPRVLWSTAVSAPVHQVTVADVADRKGRAASRVVVATSHGFAVLDPRNGKLDSDVDTGAFQPGVLVTDGVVLASGDDLTAYTADGRARWSYRPDGTDGKQVVYSVPATDGDGRVFLEYGGVRAELGTGPGDPAPTAVGLDVETGREQWSERPTGVSATWIQRQEGVYASSDIPSAGGHGVAFAWGGDRPGSPHQVQIVDGRTGEVLRADDSVGAATFQGFTSSAANGLMEMHSAMMTIYPPDGSAPYGARTLGNVQDGEFVTTAGGDETFVGATGGALQWKQPFPNNINHYHSAESQLFAFFAGDLRKVDLGRTGATDLLGLPFDYSAYNLNEEVGGYGYNSRAIDSYPHGISIMHVDESAAPSGETVPSADQATSEPVDAPTLPTGLATAPHRILSSTAVRPNDDTEVTRGYSPQQMQRRLGLTGDGEGQTVAISIAYHYANARSDLNHFAEHFGLPQTCDAAAKGEACFEFKQVYADGTQPAEDANWNEEAALDIEWAHSVAPKAKIVLVEAADASASALYAAVDLAASMHPAAINNSWGMSEFSEQSFYDKRCKVKSVCVQSTGDAGWPAGYSSTNPWALAIGGTHLELDADGNTLAESAWTSGGGGLSYFAKRPAYQDGVQGSKYRATPDVSMVADPRTGAAVYVTVEGTSYWLEVGGTSLSAPIWSGILGATDELRAADGKAPLAVAGAAGDTAHHHVYALGDDVLADVTEGANGLCGAECTAGPGFDTVTGLGSPVAGVDRALADMR